MNFKTRILAIFLAASMSVMPCLANAFAADAEENVTNEDYKHFDPELYDDLENEHDAPVRYDENDPTGSQAGLKPEIFDGNAAYDFFNETAELYVDTHLYEFTKEQLMDAFIKKVITENPLFFQSYLNALLSTMDEYSAYYPYESGFLSASQGLYGVVYYSPDEGERKALGLSEGVYIERVIAGSGAEQAGVKAGDKIIAIGGFNVEGLTFQTVQNLVKVYPFTVAPKEEENPVTIGLLRDILNGKETDPAKISLAIEFLSGLLAEAEAKANEPEKAPATEPAAPVEPVSPEVKEEPTLDLKIERKGEYYDFKITKSVVSVMPISTSYNYEKKIATIVIEAFSADGMGEYMRNILEGYRKKNVPYYIIDLRNNGGGYVDQAIDIANLFVEDKGEVLFYWNSRKHEKPEAVRSTGVGKEYGEIAVLVNEYTASASELLAMILREKAGAKIFGMTTYGKAVGQAAYPLTNGDTITITSTEILTPALRSYNGIGLEPNLEIDTLEMHFEFPEELRNMTLTYEDYLAIKPGVYSDSALAFEKFFAFLGSFSEEYADGIFDENTTKAINAYLIFNRREQTGVLEESDITRLVEAVNGYKAYFYYYDSQYAVAEISFSSFSQAKRLKKELERASEKAAELKKQYYNEYLEQLKAEEEAAKAENAANTENTPSAS